MDDPLEKLEEEQQCRIVDGFYSSRTYIVLATQDDVRLSMRCLGYNAKYNAKAVPDGEEPKIAIGIIFKVHIERDADVRGSIDPRAYARFDLASEWFSNLQTRLTGVFYIPFAYLGMPVDSIKNKLESLPLIELMWDALMAPAESAGAKLDTNRRTFTEWVAVQKQEYDSVLNSFQYYVKEGEAVRGQPEAKVVWMEIGAQPDVQSGPDEEEADEEDTDDEDVDDTKE